jgi:taurine dioxygenase
MREDTGHGRENGWHADVTWMEQPSLGSIAQLIEGTPIGGDILFSDSHACYLGLPTEHQKRIEYLHGHQRRPHFSRRLRLHEAYG